MHPVNAMKIAHAKADHHSLDEAFDAIRSLSGELIRRDLKKEHMAVPANDMKMGLMQLLGRHDHSPAFKSAVYGAFGETAAYVTTLEREASIFKYWKKSSIADRLDFCRTFNDRVVQNLLDETQIKASGTDVCRIDLRKTPIVPIAPLSAREYFDIQPHSSHRKERNVMRVNTDRISGFSDPYRTIRNMTSSIMYLFMENMTRNNTPVREDYKDDHRLWHRMTVDNGTVSGLLDQHFSAQYFRRVWDDVANRTVEHLKDAIDGATHIAEPPKRGFLRRLLKP